MAEGGRDRSRESIDAFMNSKPYDEGHRRQLQELWQGKSKQLQDILENVKHCEQEASTLRLKNGQLTPEELNQIEDLQKRIAEGKVFAAALSSELEDIKSTIEQANSNALNQPDVPRRSMDQQTTSSRKSSALKMKEVQTKIKLTELKMAHQKKVGEIRRKLKQLSREKCSSNSNDEKKRLESEMQSLEDELLALEIDFTEQEDGIKELSKLEQEIIQLKEDDEQHLDSEEENVVKAYDDRMKKAVDAPPFIPVQYGYQSAPYNVAPEKDMAMLNLMKSMQDKIMLKDKDEKLPIFNGDPATWENFKSTFHRNYEPLTNNYVKNGRIMERLQMALKGNANEAVQHLYANVNNVEKIMSILQKRFGRPELILEYMLEQLKTTKPPDLGKPETIVKFGDQVDALVTNIFAFNEMDYLSNRQIVTELAGKLPATLRRGWFRWVTEVSSRKQDLRQFHKWIMMEVEIAQCEVKPSVFEFTKQTGKEKQGKCAITAAVDEDSSQEKGCFICGKPKHYAYQCKTLESKSVEERMKLVKQKGLCLNCLSKRHQVNDCGRKPCGVDGCNLKHHKLLHLSKEELKKIKPSRKQNIPTATSDEDVFSEDDAAIKNNVTKSGEPSSSSKEKSTPVVGVASTGTTLPVVPVYIEGPKGREKVFALLDCGATCCLIEDDVAEKVGLVGAKDPLTLSVFGNQSKPERNSRRVNLQVSGIFKKAQQFSMENVRTVKRLGIPGVNLNVTRIKQQHPYLDRVQMKDLKNAVPRMVIGFNYFKLFRPRQFIEKTGQESPCAYRCPLGWYIATGGSENASFQYLMQRKDGDADLHQQIKNYFSTEDFGVKIINESSRSKEDKRALDILQQTTEKVNGRWRTGLLWKSDDLTLPESKLMAMKRLHSMEKKMDSNDEFAETVQAKFKEYISEGYLKERNMESCPTLDKRRWYLPWFFAYHPTKKPRLVYDAAAKSYGQSLNDFLVKGPDFLNPLPSVLMRFRMHQVALMADVKQMFHQVMLIGDDKPAQTILYRGLNRSQEPKEYEMQVLFFGSASSPSSAIYTKDRNASEFEKEFPQAVNATRRDFYMDDLFTGDETDTNAVQLYGNIKTIHDSGGFPLVKWNSNSPGVRECIPEDLCSQKEVLLDQKQDIQQEKTLGLYWDPNEDCFSFKLNTRKYEDIMELKVIPTKREFLGVVMSLFDPLGFIAPLKVKGMIILQKIWRSAIGWDDEICSGLHELWTTWANEVKDVEKIKIPRRYALESVQKSTCIQLHTFCDASEDAFAAVTYMRFEIGENIYVSFVAGKVRVAPLKGLTIPRMELQAALMGSRLKRTIVRALDDKIKIDKCFYWSDSRTVLCWLRSITGRFNPFIANRVGEISELTNVEDWHWISTKDNVADDATRVDKQFDCSSTSRWLTGPKFLIGKVENFPNEDKKNTAADVIKTDLEMKEEICTTIVSESLAEKFSLPSIGRYSSWMKLLRATATIVFAVRSFQKKGPRQLTNEDMSKAKHLWIRKSQSVAFGNEVRLLKKGKDIPKTSRLYKLSPGFENGIIVLCGRIKNALLSQHVKNPPILDPKEDYCKLMMRYYHNICQHQGQELIMNALRRETWIISCRSAVRRIKAECLVCRKRNALPEAPLMGQLPIARLDGGKRPFYHTGIDYFGPFLLKPKRKTRSTVMEKRWGVMLTCLTTRAVHLELAESLEASDMIKVLIRFINRRGAPANIWSDNGTNFVGGNREIRESLMKWEASNISNAMLNRGINWSFIPPGSPHMGGSWEAQIKCVKRILSSILKEQHPQEWDMMTLFTEVEHILNSRPITRVSPDPDDLMPLTPNHLLNVPCVRGPSVPGNYDDGKVYKKSWHFVQKLAQDFWKRWSVEYLPWLVKRNKWTTGNKPLEVGDVVIVLEDNMPRNVWKTGRLTKVYPAKDGQVRKVEVIITHVDPSDPKKTVKTSVLQRPAVKICPLKI